MARTEQQVLADALASSGGVIAAAAVEPPSEFAAGAQLVAGAAAAVLVAANPDRLFVRVQNVSPAGSTAVARVGLVGVTAVTGIVELRSGESVLLRTTQELHSIRVGLTDAPLLVTEGS